MMQNADPQGAGVEVAEDDLDRRVLRTSTAAPARYRKTDRKNPRQQTTLSEPVIVARWSKNRNGDAIALTLKTYDGANLVDLRTFFPDRDGKLQPGKGFACLVKHLPKIVREFARAEERARELGLIEVERDQ